MAKAVSPAWDTDYAPTQLVPLAQLQPAPWNPRLIKDARFKQLCDSLQADPQFLWDRPILANVAGIVHAGNMRWRAAEHLGWQAIPARITDVDDQTAQERALRDNNQFGEWDYEALAELVSGLQAQESDLATLGFDASVLEPLLAATWTPADVDDAAVFERDDDAPGLGRPIVVTTEQREVIDRAIAHVREQCGDPDTSEGRCIELMAGDYLAGA